MRFKKDLPRLTSSKAVVRKFLATLKNITQSHSSCINNCQRDSEKRNHLQNTLKWILKPLSSFYDYVVINYVFPESNALRQHAANCLGELDFVSTVNETSKKFCFTKHLSKATFTQSNIQTSWSLIHKINSYPAAF